MEKYKLLKDLPNAKAGEIFTLCKRELANGGDETVLVGDWCEFCEEEIEEFDILNPDKGWFEKIEEKKYGGRVPKEGAVFYYISPTGAIIKHEWVDGYICESMFDCGSAFWTHEEAEKEAKRRKAYVILKEDTKGFGPDWKNANARKHAVHYDHVGKKLENNLWYAWQSQPGLLFATREDAEASIKAHSQEWLDYLGIEEKKR